MVKIIHFILNVIYVSVSLKKIIKWLLTIYSLIILMHKFKHYKVTKNSKTINFFPLTLQTPSIICKQTEFFFYQDTWGVHINVGTEKGHWKSRFNSGCFHTRCPFPFENIWTSDMKPLNTVWRNASLVLLTLAFARISHITVHVTDSRQFALPGSFNDMLN